MTMSPVLDALNEAERFAVETIHSDPSAERFAVETIHSGPSAEACLEPANRVVVVHNSPIWWYHSVDCCQRSVSEKKENKLILLAIAAGTAILAASYFLGQEAAQLFQANAQKLLLQDRKIEVLASGDHRRNQVKDVLDLENQILDSTRHQSMIGIAMKSALIASAAIFGIGVLKGSAMTLIDGGMAAYVAVLGASLAQWGYLDADTSKQEMAQKMLFAIKEIRQKV